MFFGPRANFCKIFAVFLIPSTAIRLIHGSNRPITVLYTIAYDSSNHGIWSGVAPSLMNHIDV